MASLTPPVTVSHGSASSAACSVTYVRPASVRVKTLLPPSSSGRTCGSDEALVLELGERRVHRACAGAPDPVAAARRSPGSAGSRAWAPRSAARGSRPARRRAGRGRRAGRSHRAEAAGTEAGAERPERATVPAPASAAASRAADRRDSGRSSCCSARPRACRASRAVLVPVARGARPRAPRKGCRYSSLYLRSVDDVSTIYR